MSTILERDPVWQEPPPFSLESNPGVELAQPFGWTESGIMHGLSQIGQLRLEYEIDGEAFGIEFEAGYTYLVHREWSLVGVGHDLAEAEVDLRNEALIYLEGLAEFQIGSFSADELDMLDYLYRIA